MYKQQLCRKKGRNSDPTLGNPNPIKGLPVALSVRFSNDTLTQKFNKHRTKIGDLHGEKKRTTMKQ